MKNAGAKITATILAAFGLLTLFLSTSVIFDLFGIREKEGNYVMFVVIANFVASLLYLHGAWSLLRMQRAAVTSLAASAILLFAALIGLWIYIGAGGVHETKTIYAMIFRTALSGVFTFIAYKLIKPSVT